MKTLVIRIAAFVVFMFLLSVDGVKATNLPLTNFGFETPGSIPSGLDPVVLNQWRGDPSDSVTTENGILPANGDRMLKFLVSYPTGPIGYDCAIWQILNVGSFQSAIEAGGVILTGSALFNRIPGDIQTDTEFGVGLKAYSEMPVSFHDEIANIFAPMYSDGNPETWERGEAVLTLPTTTKYVGIYILALENAFDDSSSPEFDGHYTDSVILSISAVPEPSTIALLGMGAIGLLAWAWRRAKLNRIVVCFIGLSISTAGMAQAVTIETVPVGNINNAADASTGYGSVDHAYAIGKYEVTAGQYCEFLNAKAKTDTYGLYTPYMWSGTYACKIQQSGSSGSYAYSVATDYANRPVNCVSFWDAARFTNWLCNGQGVSADTETGAYTLTPAGIAANNITKNAGASWWIPSENEWYKAAYNNGGSAATNYFLYPTSSNTAPGRDLADISGNNANTYGNPYPIDSAKYTTVVGEFQNSDSPYGTFDQGGNIWEWNDSIPYSSSRGLRGGSFFFNSYDIASSARGNDSPANEYGYYGFRVASVPEPGGIALLLTASLGGLFWWRRRS